MRKATRRTQPYRGTKGGASQGPPGPARNAMRLGEAMGMPNPMNARRKLAKGSGLGAKMQRLNAPVPGNFVPGLGGLNQPQRRPRGAPNPNVRPDNNLNPRRDYGPRPTRAPYRKGQRFRRNPTRRTPGSRRHGPTLN